MSDRIKKIKIKKQDGTFSDYIPIGADAENIDTTDGESVQLKLNKKPYYYENVAAMKADNKLKTGDMAITLGYYESNDGGAGEYRIINGNYVDDGGNYHQLNNNLFAELINKNTVNVKQFGAYGDGIHDDTNAIQAACINKEILLNPDSNFLITATILLHSNIKIIGHSSSNIIINSNFNVFTGSGESETVTIDEYLISIALTKFTRYGFTINNQKYEFFNEIGVPENSTFLINLKKKVLIIIEATTLREFEYKLEEVNSFTTGTIELTLGAIVSSHDWTSPKTYLQNIYIDGICAKNQGSVRGTSKLISLTNCKNINIINNIVENMGLVRCAITHSDEASGTTQDNYIYRGINTYILNENIFIDNNTIIGRETSRVNQLTGSDGIYLQFSKNCKINNNIIKNLYHGISLWGGNVGTPYLWKKDFLNFINNITMNNNYIDHMAMGGIWSSRSQDLRVDNNYVAICGDVNIDFEGSRGCIASNNTCYDSANGCLATLFNSYDIMFVNNYCEDKGYFENGDLVLNHTARTSYQKISFIGNTFVCNNKQIIIGHQQPGSNGNSEIIYNGNIFRNVCLRKNTFEAPELFITNNTFELTAAALNTHYNIIDIMTSNRHGTDAVITNNKFLVVAGNTNSTGKEYQMNSDYAGIYAIRFYRGVWTGRNDIIIENNVIENLPNAIMLEKTLTDDNYAYMYMHLFNNIISGTVDNHSVKTGARIYFENNKTPRLNSSGYTNSSLRTFPSSIPTEDTQYVSEYLKNSRIYFDEPDADGYTMAICTQSGNPGVWKRTGKIEE